MIEAVIGAERNKSARPDLVNSPSPATASHPIRKPYKLILGVCIEAILP
jgi:hypothetical protein